MTEFKIILRGEWGATGGRGHDVTSNLPWQEVVIHKLSVPSGFLTSAPWYRSPQSSSYWR